MWQIENNKMNYLEIRFHNPEGHNSKFIITLLQESLYLEQPIFSHLIPPKPIITIKNNHQILNYYFQSVSSSPSFMEKINKIRIF